MTVEAALTLLCATALAVTFWSAGYSIGLRKRREELVLRNVRILDLEAEVAMWRSGYEVAAQQARECEARATASELERGALAKALANVRSRFFPTNEPARKPGADYPAAER